MSDTELSPLEQHTQDFLANPDVSGLLELYAFLKEELLDEELAGILDKIRPIQHRVTLIQADATGTLLEALCRDPHRDVRKVVASHANITQEVCFRLSEDPEHVVRLALRKNPHCHPVIQAALILREKRGDERRVKADHLLEISWQARRCKLDTDELMGIFADYVHLDAEDLPEIELEQANKVLDVLAAHLGDGPMPRKPRKKASKKRRPTRKK